MMDDEQDKDSVTLKSMLVTLERRIQVTQCSLRGMVTPEGDIFVMLLPIAKKPSMFQLRSCVLEMEKLSTMIIQKNPSIMMEVPLSALTGAEVLHTQVSSSSNNKAYTWMLSSLFFFLLQKSIVHRC